MNESKETETMRLRLPTTLRVGVMRASWKLDCLEEDVVNDALEHYLRKLGCLRPCMTAQEKRQLTKRWLEAGKEFVVPRGRRRSRSTGIVKLADYL